MNEQHPEGLDEAIDSWNANCGPAALAAVLGLHMQAVREAVSEAGVFRGYMNITHMKLALERMGARYRSLRSPTMPELLRAQTVVCVQWSGPWNEIPRAAATYRHFIATSGGRVYDVNSGWVEAIAWLEQVVPGLIPRRGDGRCLYTWAASICK